MFPFWLIFIEFIILQATAPSLDEKLGKLAPAHAVAGYIASYFVERLAIFIFVSHGFDVLLRL